MTPNTDATSTEEKGELEEAFNGTASNGEDVFSFLNLPSPHGAPSASAANATESTGSVRTEREDGGGHKPEDARAESGTAANRTQAVALAVPTAVSEGLPATIHQALVADLPQDGTPGEIITACERRLYAAQTLRDAMEKRALVAYFHYAGPAVRLAHSSGSWQDIIDPSTGKPCRSWSAWLRTAKVSRQHAFRMVKEEPLMKALEGLNVGALGVRQIDALSPVLTNHGQEKVRLVWTTAAEIGDTGAPSLEKVRDQLGLAVNPAGDDEGPDQSPTTPVLKFQASPGTFDEGRVREVARAQPEVALLVARTILSELADEDPTER
ncbi:hypothetical protein [Streptomyces olivaceus]|uniref:hypothetical protein n=1 Tax=Streptomyces olivaceus TaxID=47716 RepID=UPI0022EEE8B8|nr:hypothetical protein [Streptomyces olivaceus]GHI98046.1 hypothetical protein TPA0905_75170 [Streptomyces olivaceus]